jgi:hypothetical protein
MPKNGLCPLCNQRKAKRACPALGQQICAVCCGTKRLVEIACPADCIYLMSARSHPPAVAQRQQEHDRLQMLPLLQGLSERQARGFLTVAALILRHRSDALQKLLDEDIVQATDAMASTLETAGRGILYEHQPASLPAARLMAEIKTLVAEVAKGSSGLERDLAIGLRRLQMGAKQGADSQPDGSAFQQLLARVLAPPPGSGDDRQGEPPAASPSSLIIP